MCAPVVLRFNTYGATLSPTSQSYLRHALQDAHLQAWIRGAEQELARAGNQGPHR